MKPAQTLTQEIIQEAMLELCTIADFLRWSTTQLEKSDVFYGHGTDNPWDEASALVLQSLHLPFDLPESMFVARLTSTEKQLITQRLAARINEKKPLAYITNESYFCHIPFYVDERVLVPRSPIAELIENQFSDWVNPEQVFNILDLCTGSGCIAIACAEYFPQAVVSASDLSLDALEVAQINVESLGLDDRVCLLESDIFDRIPEQQFDIIVSNPPYVDKDDIDSMPSEFSHEPLMGLEAGDDGLILVHRILKQAHQFLSEDGILIVEVGNSCIALEEAYPTLDFQWIEFERGGDGVFALTKQQLVEHFG